jgi:hypothetical protein
MGVVEHIYNSSIKEAEAGGSQVLGQPGLFSEPLSQNNNQKQKKERKEKEKK